MGVHGLDREFRKQRVKRFSHERHKWAGGWVMFSAFDARPRCSIFPLTYLYTPLYSYNSVFYIRFPLSSTFSSLVRLVLHMLSCI